MQLLSEAAGMRLKAEDAYPCGRRAAADLGGSFRYDQTSTAGRNEWAPASAEMRLADPGRWKRPSMPEPSISFSADIDKARENFLKHTGESPTMWIICIWRFCESGARR